MLSSQGRHASAPRKHYESDSDRPRHTMASTQRYTNEYATGTAMPDRPHRSSRRADTSGNPLAFESAPSANKHSSSREQPYARGPSHNMFSEPQAQASMGPMTTAGVASSSRSRAHDQGHDPDLYAYAKRRTDRQSPRSSEEKVYGADQGKPSRATQQLRSVHHTANPVPQLGTAYATSSQYQSARDPTSSSMYRKDRGDKDQGEDRERRRERRRDKERLREEEERLRERAAIETQKELEKQRRRDERRAERDKERERERRREEKELERARRHREKTREYESRARDESHAVNPVYLNASLVPSKYQNSVSQYMYLVLLFLTFYLCRSTKYHLQAPILRFHLRNMPLLLALASLPRVIHAVTMSPLRRPHHHTCLRRNGNLAVLIGTKYWLSNMLKTRAFPAANKNRLENGSRCGTAHPAAQDISDFVLSCRRGIDDTPSGMPMAMLTTRDPRVVRTNAVLVMSE